jgi:hypothetical protein
VELPGAWLLLAPAGLLGLLALAVPVAIHMISRGRGRRVLIGNIELLRAARQTRVTTLRLTQWLLLLLRVLIVLVATLLLARLAVQGLGSVDAGVSYVTPGWLRAATETERAEVLTLEPAARVLVAGYPEAGDYAPDDTYPDYDAWPLLTERLSTLRHAGTVEVFAERSVAAFGRQKPALPNEINWHLAAVAAAPATFDSRGLVVHDRDRVDDALRIERALEALQRHRVPRLEWKSCLVDDASCAGASPDWVAWLSDAEPPGKIDSARLHRSRGPEWTLALSDPRYPEVLLDTVLSDEQRRVAWQQIPVSVDVLGFGTETAASIRLPYRSLHPWLGLLLVMLWAAERLFSERRRADDD